MGEEKFKYFISYVDEDNKFHNTEIIRDNFIESFDDIKNIQDDIKTDLHHSKVTIINYRVF